MINSSNIKRVLFLTFVTCFYVHTQSQDIKTLYEQADSFRQKYESKFYYGINNIQPINKTHRFWYMTNTENGKEYLIMDADNKKTYPAFDHKKLAESLHSKLNQNVDRYKLPFTSIRYSEKLDSLYFDINKIPYACSLNNYQIVQLPDVPNTESYWGGVFKEDRKDKIKSPDNKQEAYISEGNLWVRNLETGVKTKISTDGSDYEYYSSNIYWSPDSKKIVCCKYRPAEIRKLLLISSSPTDQLQPKTEEYDYPKPGDALAIRKPVVFFVDEKRAVEFNVSEVDKQFDLGNIRWNKDSDFFTFDFNKRGHQQYIIYAGNITDGSLRKIVDEKSNTFVHYGATYQHWFENTNELLWISERDGWRHLYVYDVRTGTVKSQLTKGEWIVKRIAHVDENTRTIILVACGKDKGEDPYLEKYYALNMDNLNLTTLTPENANHKVTFTDDYKFMVDNYSRMDMAPRIAVRSAIDGKVIFEPKQPDVSQVIASGWRMPEVFSAKGRDGKTDIWGVIIRPSNFDPNKKYPVIEYIYAGPHDSHVPKSFSIAERTSTLSEIGFITVMIDGMGTANRSKAFHDVCWKNLKDAGFPDRIAWIKSAAAKYPEMDTERVGIYGGSAGGQNSMGALLFHPDFYKVAVSSCGCHDNRMDKIWWNEQWMGYPIGQEYEDCSNVVNAKLLKGKLMLILGELDNNVDPSSTLQVVNELIKNNKEFEFVILPGVRHTLGETYGDRKRRDFFVRNLLGISSPEWNSK